jgi:hypothetical protein
MDFALIDKYKEKMTNKGHNIFLTQCDEVTNDFKHYSKKEIEETAIKNMLKSKDKLLYFK